MLTLEQLAAINRAVAEIQRSERARAASPQPTRRTNNAYVSATRAVDRCDELGVAYLLPDEQEIIAAERARWLELWPDHPLYRAAAADWLDDWRVA